MPRFREPLLPREIERAARAAVNTLGEIGLDCCLFGSAACWSYGMRNRTPNDVDVIALTDDWDPEAIKDQIVAYNSDFYLIPARNPNDTYQVLWYRLPRRNNASRICKVDILVPGLLSIPDIPQDRIAHTSGRNNSLPLTPFLTLLLLKLRGWSDHRADHRGYMREKVPVDEADLEELLEMAVEEFAFNVEMEDWWPQWFMDEAEERIADYVEEWPDTADWWSGLGFNVF